ncbi:toxin-antitoxin system YwqK family antitoxin [Hymenobacter crusticola]|uniref:toxin-antitoxin system YwqK family antitoxin n=1 Tax=Hymenobacter crusticola TaxID=1770526 RepID=UPI000A39B770|nr:hypothetical protein [Hymenobacter crusticola]
MPFSRLQFLLFALLLLIGACSKNTVSFNSKPDQVIGALAVNDSLTQNSDTTNLLKTKRVAMTKEEEQQAKDKDKKSKRKPKKKKNVFLGEPIKKAYTKSGPKGRNQVVEIFYYMRNPQKTDPFAPVRYYYDAHKRRILQDRAGLDPGANKILHGPYKKMQGGKVVETGFYAVGTRHLRWERLSKDNILVTKVHYERGFPRDANVTYYDGEQKQVKEVVPYVDGKLEGEYVRYLENGKRDWDGQFENGKKVGLWNKYWGFRNLPNRLHYVYQYPESGYEPAAEPILLREYNRNGVLVYEKDKLDRRDAVTDRPGTNRPGASRPGSRK